MIKRHYFMAVKKPYTDGSGSYTYGSTTANLVSLFPQPQKTYNEMAKHLAEKMRDEPGEHVLVLSFNRI